MRTERQYRKGGADMAIITETVTLNGNQYLHTYSDDGMTIIRDGVEYDDVYDPVSSGRTYTETSHKIEQTVEDIQEQLAEAQAQARKLFSIRSTIETLRDEALLPSTKAIYQAILDLFD